MSQERRKELIVSIVLKSVIVAAGITGLLASFLMTEIGAKNEALYYTVQSNIWIWAVMAVCLVLDCVALAKGKEDLMPQWLRMIKFVFTVAITLTGFVYNFVLFPASLMSPEPTNPLALDSILVHIVVPVLSIADFIKFDYRLKVDKKTALFGLITPLYYLPFALIAAELGAVYKQGERFPYFFLNHEKLSWFGFKGMPGVFYWLIIVLGIVLGISYLLLNCHKRRQKSEKFKEFGRFRENYQLNYKKIIKKGDGLYFNDVCIEDNEGNKVFETENFINTSYGSRTSIARVLSNLYPHKFKFRGKIVASIEGVLQGIKYKDKKMQNAVLKYAGLDAYHTRGCNVEDFWGKEGLLYWQGKEIKRDSKEYQKFLDELYYCAAACPLYKKVLLSTGDKYLLHHIGNENIHETVLTRFEYELRMNSLREFLRIEENK